MDFQRFIKKSSHLGRDTQGIALFMVLAAVGILSILVTDFVYITQVSQAIAYGGLDQTQAHYLAKSGLKLSLLRLKAYQKVQKLGGVSALVPKSLMERVWNFPFFYPIPTGLPGMTSGDKDLIKKFQKEMSIDGNFSATIESESTKYNLNSIVAGFGPTPTPNTRPSPGGIAPPLPIADSAKSREALTEMLTLVLNQKMKNDAEFAAIYRDFRVNEWVDQIAAWSDRKYDRRSSPNRDPIPMKRAPFYSVGELHNLAAVDEDIYQLFVPYLTTSLTSAININMMQEGVLRTLAPNMTDEDVQQFFTYRDSVSADHFFRKADDFFNYLSANVPIYRTNPKLLDELKKNLASRQISLITEETFFKITVQATVNSATRTIQAWVTLGDPQPNSPTTVMATSQSGGIPNPLDPTAGLTPGLTVDSGITITSMKID
jgi:hypothetical protein